MACRGVQGRVQVEANTEEAIKRATKRLLRQMVEENGVEVEDLACAFFLATPDLDAVHPAYAAREMGWLWTPLLCMQQAGGGSDPRCIHVLLVWNTEVPVEQVRHVDLIEQIEEVS